MSPSLFVARLKKEFPDTKFSVKSKQGLPVLYVGKKRLDVELASDEIVCLALAAEASDDDIISLYYNIIKQRVIEQIRNK